MVFFPGHKISIIILVACSINFIELFGQCNPPYSETCNNAYVFCSLDEMNGYSCNTPSTTKATCRYDCGVGGPSYYRSWWAFICQGGNVSITLHVGTCTYNQGYTGIGWGIWGDCNCTQEIICQPGYWQPGTTNTYQVNLLSCKVYYISIDAYPNVDCDFTLTTSGGGPPQVTLGDINDIPNGIIEPVCEGYCGYKFFVNSQSSCLAANYLWTLEGKEVGGNSKNLQLDFPNAGDFNLCVTAYVGNKNNPGCAVGPKCATVKVSRLPEINGNPRIICWEDANPNGFKWHNQKIYSSGKYKEEFKNNNCCKYDSVVEFIVLPVPTPSDVYYITCNNSPYIDMLGRNYFPCKDHFEIKFPKSTDEFKCDSSIYLTAVAVDVAPAWKMRCTNKKVELSPEFSISKSCSAGAKYKFDYRWYKKNDPGEVTICNNDRLVADMVNEDYCIDLNTHVVLGTESADCSKTFCESLNEGDLAPNCFPLAGDQLIPFGNNSSYKIDTILKQQVVSYLWNVIGGSIVSKPDSSSIEVHWTFAPGDSGLVCAKYITDCDTSCLKCLVVKLDSNSNCIQQCKKIEWLQWNKIANNKYQGSSIKGKATIDFDSKSGTVVSTNFTLASNVFTPKIINSVLAVFMPGIPAVSKLIHRINLSNLTDPAHTFIMVGSFPNSKKAGFTIPQIGRLRAYNSLGVQLDIPDACLVLEDLLTAGVARPTIITFNLNEITFTVTDPSTDDGGIIVLRGFPNNTAYIEVEHFDEKSYTFDGIFVDVGFEDCCSASGTSTLSVNKCTSDSNRYTLMGTFDFTNPANTGFVLIKVDGILRLKVGPNITLPLNFKIDSLVSDGLSHTITFEFMDFPDCFQSYTFDAPLAPSSPAVYGNTVCEGDSIQLKTDTALKYNWSGPLGFNSVLQNPAIPNASTGNAGSYTLTATNSEGCTSSATIDIVVLNSTRDTIVITACDTATVNSQIYTISGSVTQTLTNSLNCDSILLINLSILKSKKIDLDYNVCDSIVLDGKTYKISGNYLNRYIAASGCDSSVTYHINITSSNSSQIAFAICDSANINGTIYRQSGNYTQSLKSNIGCDSILNFDLTILKPSLQNINLAACDSAIINGQKYIQSGNYTQHLFNAVKCDSSLNINLNVSSSSSAILKLKACDSIIVNGQIYKTTGLYKQLLQNSNQCDSMLTIDFSKTGVSTSNQNYKQCDSIKLNGQTFYLSGNYQQTLVNSNNCDSVINLNLQITKSNLFALTQAGCDSAVINKQVYYQSGNYQQHLINKDLCDSTLNIDLNIFHSDTSDLMVSACDSANVNSVSYKQSGHYIQTLQSIHGCDSILNIDLSLLGKPLVHLHRSPATALRSMAIRIIPVECIRSN